MLVSSIKKDYVDKNQLAFGIESVVNLLAELRGFLKTLGLEPLQIHGGFIPFGLREQVVGDIFMVGDSCGHVAATTEEGIRPAINFGVECARIVQNIVYATGFFQSFSRRCISDDDNLYLIQV